MSSAVQYWNYGAFFAILPNIAKYWERLNNVTKVLLEVTLQNCLILIDIAWHIHIVVRNSLVVLDIARFFRSKMFSGRLFDYLRKYWTNSNIHRICIILSDIMSVLYIQSYFSSNDRLMTKWYNIKLSTWYFLLLHLM